MSDPKPTTPTPELRACGLRPRRLPRCVVTGAIYFGLVNIPIKLYPATAGRSGGVLLPRRPEGEASYYGLDLSVALFVPASTFDRRYVARTYFVGPDRCGDRAYRLVADAVARTETVALTAVGNAANSPAVIESVDGGLVLHLVRYADELRDFAEVDRPGPLDFKAIELELAEKLIRQNSGEAFVPPERREEAPAERSNVIDLFEALKRRLGPKGGK